MIEELKNIERTMLFELLEKPEVWNTLDINYYPPHVERLWTSIGDKRLMLHFIEPCTTQQALYHPHPWPSAIHVVDGLYEMGLGVTFTPDFKELNEMRKYGNGEQPWLKQICKIEFKEGYYEMLEPIGWHYVRPIKPVFSVMLIGQPWPEQKEQEKQPKEQKPWGKLPHLIEERKLELLQEAKNRLVQSVI